MTLADSPLLLKWLNDPEVLRYYEGRDRPHTPAMVREYYNPDDEGIFRCILEHNDKPIGYMQYYPLDEEARVRWGLNERAMEEITFGMDQFIGEPAYWNQGIGQMWLSSALRHVAERHQAASSMMRASCWILKRGTKGR